MSYSPSYLLRFFFLSILLATSTAHAQEERSRVQGYSLDSKKKDATSLKPSASSKEPPSFGTPPPNKDIQSSQSIRTAPSEEIIKKPPNQLGRPVIITKP